MYIGVHIGMSIFAHFNFYLSNIFGQHIVFNKNRLFFCFCSLLLLFALNLFITLTCRLVWSASADRLQTVFKMWIILLYLLVFVIFYFTRTYLVFTRYLQIVRDFDSKFGNEIFIMPFMSGVKIRWNFQTDAEFLTIIEH